MKQLVPILMIMLFISFLISCKKKKVNYPETSKKIIDSITKQNILNSDTITKEDYSVAINIDTPSVVFFMPNYREKAKLYRFYGYYSKFELEQLFRNFYRFYNVVRPTLIKNNINTFLTYHWVFRIQTDSGYVDYDRKAQEEIIGFILADGHSQPQIFYGLYNLKEFQKLVSEYFDLSNFEITEKYEPLRQSTIEGSP